MKESKNDRDASMDRLLTGTLKARAAAAPADACLDAETVAAWADGALNPSQRAVAEAHAADCGRCQALLAAMVRTAPPAAAVAGPWWRIPALTWLVPLTAAAMALALWVAVPNRAPVQVSDGGVAAVDQAVPAQPATRADRAAPADQPAQAQIPTRPTAAAPAPHADLQAKAARDETPVLARERQESAALDKQTARAAQTPNALSETIAVAPAASPSVVAPAPTVAPAEARALGATARMSAFANAVETVIVSSNPATRFRLLPGGGVQRSADGGATWRTEVTGATETLTAGSSPSPSVCWLIGPSGAIFLSTDGRTWRRVAFPETEDLRAVTATDKENATVTTVTGHTFVTTDAGQTWVRSGM